MSITTKYFPSQGEMKMDDINHLLVHQQYSFEHINSITTTTVKASSGLLHALVINTPINTGKITIFDSTEVGGQIIAEIINGTNVKPWSLIYDIEFINGLTIVTAVKAQDITVSYE